MTRPLEHQVILILHEDEQSNQSFLSRKAAPIPAKEGGSARLCSRKAVGEINDWLGARGCTGKFFETRVGTTFVCYNPNMDIELFMVHLHTLPWARPQDVQVLYRAPTESRYVLWELKMDYFKDVQEFLASEVGNRLEVRKMMENAILLQRQEEGVVRKIRRDVDG